MSNPRTPFYDFVRQRFRSLGEEGVLEVMNVLIGSSQGPLQHDFLITKAAHPAAERAVEILLSEGFIARSDGVYDATQAGRVLLPVLGPVFEWAHGNYRSLK